MRRTAILDIVGLSPRLLDERMPRLAAHAARYNQARIRPVLPALTCSAQATYLTGKLPEAHGIVGNGWYDRALAEHHFWKQSNHLMSGEKLWETLRRESPGFTCAKLFWWYNMYSSADWSITPRPMYPADGRKVFDIYTQPPELREQVKEKLGEFPFPAFWGPRAGIASSQWIAASAKWIEQQHLPDLSLVYLPHLDYNLQRLGPNDPAIAQDLAAIDAVVGELLEFYAAREVQVIVLSEYAITPVRRSLALNRLFRKEGWIRVRHELGRELLDCGASRAFAIADHQIAHVYLNDNGLMAEVRALLEKAPEVACVLGPEELRDAGLAHPRTGDLVAVSHADAWFTWYYWEDDARAPDFARCVDIHRKYGYDPVELFVDPAIRFPTLAIGAKLLRKKLGFRGLFDVVPLAPHLVRGSHGAIPSSDDDFPVLISPHAALPSSLRANEVHGQLLAAIRAT